MPSDFFLTVVISQESKEGKCHSYTKTEQVAEGGRMEGKASPPKPGRKLIKEFKSAELTIKS